MVWKEEGPASLTALQLSNSTSWTKHTTPNSLSLRAQGEAEGCKHAEEEEETAGTKWESGQHDPEGQMQESLTTFLKAGERKAASSGGKKEKENPISDLT